MQVKLKRQKNSKKKDLLAKLDDTNEEYFENIIYLLYPIPKKVKISLKYRRKTAQNSSFNLSNDKFSLPVLLHFS